MRLSAFLNHSIHLPPVADVEVTSLALDSRLVCPGAAFIAKPGKSVDGRQFIHDAIERGAKAVLVNADDVTQPILWERQVPLIPVDHLEKHIGEMAAAFYQCPAKELRVLGVTGTNGKTSCTHFLAQTLQVPCGVIGTLGTGFLGHLMDTGFTTPDQVSLQRELRLFVDQGASAVAMEVSSHGIDQGRVAGVDFEFGIFTNLTQDHLDYHGSMDEYAKAKRRFLADPRTKTLVINVEDDYGRAWVSALKQDKPIFAYSTEAIAFDDAPLTYTTGTVCSLAGITAKVHTPWGEGELQLPLIGRFNLSNALAVLTTLCAYGVPFNIALQRLNQLKPVPGRMQTLGGGAKPLVVVDYSHTPDSLEKALTALRAHTSGQLICVFGCGGERDALKRPIMANVAERLADRVIVTNDNPRHENPEVIAQHILGGFLQKERVLLQLDRSHAIENSIQLAKNGDCVLIAGKGAERYQLIGDEKLPFDDVEKAKQYLE